MRAVGILRGLIHNSPNPATQMFYRSLYIIGYIGYVGYIGYIRDLVSFLFFVCGGPPRRGNNFCFQGARLHSANTPKSAKEGNYKTKHLILLP